VFVPAARPLEEIREVQALVGTGLTHREISRRTSVPLETIRAWLHNGFPRSALSAARGCGRCGGPVHDFAELPPETYSYLLGLYLGDGCVHRRGGRAHVLKIACDAAYPQIIESARQAVAEIRGRRPWAGPGGGNCIIVVSYWKQWPCLLPQHGAGRKHNRRIELVEWQRELVERDPRPLLRGLIETDGWRGLNRVFVKGRRYAYPRYQFSNRSADIRRIFTDACDLIGVEWRPWGKWHISVARRRSVAILDEFIGPKR